LSDGTYRGFVRPPGRPVGMKPIHAVYAVVLFVVWFAVLGFVLTHGRHESSSVDVYTELPPGFTAQLQAKGVLYGGLSPVDSATVQQAMAHATTTGSTITNTAGAIVLRTSFSDTGRKHAKYTDQPALMVVVPSTSSASPGSTGQVLVEFLDPTSYRVLQTVSYAASG
jgi:hypothetical protein